MLSELQLHRQMCCMQHGSPIAHEYWIASSLISVSDGSAGLLLCEMLLCEAKLSRAKAAYSPFELHVKNVSNVFKGGMAT